MKCSRSTITWSVLVGSYNKYTITWSVLVGSYNKYTITWSVQEGSYNRTISRLEHWRYSHVHTIFPIDKSLSKYQKHSAQNVDLIKVGFHEVVKTCLNSYKMDSASHLHIWSNVKKWVHLDVHFLVDWLHISRLSNGR